MDNYSLRLPFMHRCVCVCVCVCVCLVSVSVGVCTSVYQRTSIKSKLSPLPLKK